MSWIRDFKDLTIDDVPIVGGKNASLGQMLRELGPLGVRVPGGFATTADAYRHFVSANDLAGPIRDELAAIDGTNVEVLGSSAKRIRNFFLAGTLPEDLATEIRHAYRQLDGDNPAVAVRSSATAEDLPTASFAGQQETYLHIHGEDELLESVVRCFASLFTARAINYRSDMGFDHFSVALSVGVQTMVNSDDASAGVMFTLDTESGFRDVIQVTSSYGLGESVVQGRVSPDEFYVHKPTLRQGHRSIVWKRCGTKESRMVFDDGGGRLRVVPVPSKDRVRLSLSDDEVLELARWGQIIEDHYSEVRGVATPMDIEWAKDAISGELFIVQARPETVHSQQKSPTMRSYRLEQTGEILAEGLAIGDRIGAGNARVIASADHIGEFQPGEVLVTGITDPDWEPLMKTASAIVTERGGRTSHAAIVAREIGVPAVVAATGAMASLKNGAPVTVSCAEGATGIVYGGALPFAVDEINIAELPPTTTKIMLNLAQPEKAFKLAQFPSDGVGLARMEFVFAGWVGVHPLALTRYSELPFALRREIDAITAGYDDKLEFFVDRLSQGIGTLAAAFWPRPVILRFSDFKTNEYAHLTGGEAFEPVEQNPMIGWRGASRYYHPDFREGFMLEVAAIRRVREEFGLTNLKVMVPFCRTPEEGAKVLETAAEGGLVRGEKDLEVYVMAEIPSNIFLADRFAELFDGFSIGSNDLTQLVLGVDRDSDKIAHLFDERNEAVKRACVMLLETAHAAGRTVGICGQAPSDYPDFAAFLVEHGIDSLSLSPDAVAKTRVRIAELENSMKSSR